MEHFREEGDFIYCFSCFGIMGVFTLYIPNIDQTDEVVRDVTGRLFSKKICKRCIEKIAESDLKNQAAISNQFQDEDMVLRISEEKSDLQIDEVLESIKNKNTMFLLFKKKKGTK